MGHRELGERCGATGLVAGGVDIRTAQTRLGHSDVRLTLEIYRASAEAGEKKKPQA
jgi:site-specific recombinase XerD